MKKEEFKEKILIFEPHPDDVTYQIAGTVFKWCDQGKNVMVCTVTNGNNSTFDPKETSAQIAATMKTEHLEAMKSLGIDQNHLIMWNYNDLGLDEGRDRQSLLKDMVLLIRQVKPTTVVTMDPKNRPMEENGDHRMVALVGFEAAAQAAYPNVFRDQITETLQPHFVSRVLFYMTPDPNLFSEISGDPLEMKKKLGKLYPSQLKLMTTEIDKRLRNLGLNPEILDVDLNRVWDMVCESTAEETAQLSRVYYKAHPEVAPRVPMDNAEAFRMYYLGAVEKLSGYLPKEWQTL